MRERGLSFDYVADDAIFYGSNEAMTQSLFRSFRCCQHSCQPSFQGGLAWVLGLASVGTSMVHLFFPEQFHQAIPPYLPFSFLLIGVVGFCQCAAGVGLLMPHLRRPAGWLLTFVVLVTFPANAHLFFDAFYSKVEMWQFALIAVWVSCQLVLVMLVYAASAPWTRPHPKELSWLRRWCHTGFGPTLM